MANSTPGPWEWDSGMLYAGENVLANATYEGNIAVSEANARLIAAAPELLAALERVCDILQGGSKFETLEPWARMLVEDARAAIAKAKGSK